MKKVLGLVCAGMMLFGTAVSASDITVEIDGKNKDLTSDPIIYNDRTMVPVRDIAEMFGAEVFWDNDARAAIIKNNSKIITLTIDSKKCRANDFDLRLDAEPVISNDRTMVPLRFIAEQFNLNVEWDNNLRKVIITSRGETTYDTIERETRQEIGGNSIAEKRVYTGELMNNVPNGLGKEEIYHDGELVITREGCFRDGKLTGYGTTTIEGGAYEFSAFYQDGNLLDGFVSGNAMNRALFEGEFTDKKGVVHFINMAAGIEYDGEAYYKEDTVFSPTGAYAPLSIIPHGKGIMKYTDGGLYEGDFEDGAITGSGVATFSNGERYEGEFKAGYMNGWGTYYNADGSMKYQGEFDNGNIK